VIFYLSGLLQDNAQTLKKAAAIFRPVSSVLLILLNMTPDQPIAKRKPDVHGPHRLGGKVFVRGPDSLNQ
jgi:hypothetical protein